MQYQAVVQKAENHRGPGLVVACYEDSGLSKSAKIIDKKSGGKITELWRQGDLNGKPGNVVTLHGVDRIPAGRVIIAGLGKQGTADFSRLAGGILHVLGKAKVKNIAIAFDAIDDAAAQEIIEQFEYSSYIYTKTKKANKNKISLGKVEFLCKDRKTKTQLDKTIKTGKAVGAGVNLARELGNLPANLCTPGKLANKARALAKTQKKLTVQVLSEADMRKLKMNALLSVARGSKEPAKVIVLNYKGATTRDKPYVLVGKGITFDSGGISIKPSKAMDEMKFDMCGAASVLGTLQAVVDLDLKINVVGIIPAAENLPGGAASKPGDVVTSMSGQTIEILNTDAEGRLILSDALTYAKKFKPAEVVDIATLTGACVVALGHHASGLMSNDEKLAKELLKAGEQAKDRAWQLPLWNDYDKQINTNFADMANIGDGSAGTITAACFLARFAKDYRWAHLDIAGTAWDSGKKKGATGRPVKLLLRYLMNK